MSQPRGPIRLRKCQQADGLVLWYPLCSPESAATTQLDHSGKGTHLATTWSAAQNSLAYMPDYGYGMALGSTGFTRLIVDHGVMDSLAGGPITIAFWYRRVGTVTATPVHLIGCGQASASGGFAVAGAVTNNNNLGYFPGTSSLGTLASHWFDLGIRPLDTTEHHCITGTGPTLIHYVNGLPATTWTLSGTQAQPTTWTGARYFGSGYTGANPTHNLTLADVRIYARALNAQEVWSLFDPATRFDLWDRPRLTLYSPSESTPTATNRRTMLGPLVNRPLTPPTERRRRRCC